MAQEFTMMHDVLPNGHTFHWNNRKYHVVEHFRDNGDFLYVLKHWAHGEWQYVVWSAFEYDITIRQLTFNQ